MENAHLGNGCAGAAADGDLVHVSAELPAASGRKLNLRSGLERMRASGAFLFLKQK